MKGLVGYQAHTLLSLSGRQYIAAVYDGLNRIVHQSAAIINEDLTTGEKLMELMERYTSLVADGKAEQPDFVCITFGPDDKSIALTACSYNDSDVASIP